MLKKLIFKFILGVVILVLLIKFLTIVIIEPWVGRKIQAVLNEKSRDYIFEIKKVHIIIIRSEIELYNITISSKIDHKGLRDLNGEIASIKFKGINLTKAMFKKDIDIREVTISNININGKILFSQKEKPPIVSPLNIRIGTIFFDKIDLAIKNTTTAQYYSVKEGVLKMYDLQVKKQDTISFGIVKKFDFVAEELISVSSDSMYSYTVCGIIYSDTSNTLAVDKFSIHPNYKNYNFTARYKFQTDRIEAKLSNILIRHFSPLAYLKSRSLLSPYIEIGKMDVKVFRDNRKEFRHMKKPAFQDIIYNYPGTICIDSICILNGNVTFTSHVEDANKPGKISFNEIKAKILKITNDTIYKTRSAFIELRGHALLMGKGKLAILLKARLFDIGNTFSLMGTLSGFEAKELNPILEKNAFFYVTSGKIDAMNFSFTANNAKATGKMVLLYHGFKIADKNKQTDKTTAIKEKLISFIANIKFLDSNPLLGKDVRVGVIDYNRDPERFLFGYCFKSILSGIKSSLTKSSKSK